MIITLEVPSGSINDYNVGTVSKTIPTGSITIITSAVPTGSITIIKSAAREGYNDIRPQLGQDLQQL